MKKYLVNVEMKNNDEVIVEANSIEEAKEKAKRAISKCYEYIDYSSDDIIAYVFGYGTEKVVSCSDYIEE